MKKVIGAILTVIAFIDAILFIYRGIRVIRTGMGSFSIIGGEDGPTSVFLAGKVGTSHGVVLLVIGIVLAALAGVLFYFFRKKTK